jgi:hypothetical protein
MTGRTGPPAATKRTSAFAHEIVVWLRLVLLEWLTRFAVCSHAKIGTEFVRNGALLELRLIHEWYYLPD